MSRIHDALRRAEEERLANGPATEALEEGPVTPSVGIPASFADAVLATPATTPSGPDLGGDSSYSAEGFFKRLRHPNWSPDMSKLLFMNGNSHVGVGTEEF